MGKVGDDPFQPAFDRLETINKLNHFGTALSAVTLLSCDAADGATRRDRAAAQLNESYLFSELLEE